MRPCWLLLLLLLSRSDPATLTIFDAPRLARLTRRVCAQGGVAPAIFFLTILQMGKGRCSLCIPFGAEIQGETTASRVSVLARNVPNFHATMAR